MDMSRYQKAENDPLSKGVYNIFSYLAQTKKQNMFLLHALNSSLCRVRMLREEGGTE